MSGVNGCNVRGSRGGVTRRACADRRRCEGLGVARWCRRFAAVCQRFLHFAVYVCARLWIVHFEFEFGAGSARAALQLVAQAQDAPWEREV
jgi:hypothetical protein